MGVLRFQAHSMNSKRAGRIPDEEWRSKRPLIEDMYIRQDCRLKDVMALMHSRHGFVASRRQYEYHLALWDIGKYRRRKASKDIRLATLPATDAVLLPASMTTNDSSFESDPTLLEPHAANDFDLLLKPTGDPSANPLSLLYEAQFYLPLESSSSSTSVDQQTPTEEAVPSISHLNPDLSRLDAVVGRPTPVCPEHQWQRGQQIWRMWELNTPLAERTREQQTRCERLIWCLWLCGHRTCFTHLARGVEHRVVRVEDDLSRFEAKLEDWIETCHAASRSRQVDPHAKVDESATFTHASPNNTRFGFQDWKSHSMLGREMAMLQSADKLIDKQKLAERLEDDMKQIAERGNFFNCHARTFSCCKRYLSAEIANLEALDNDVQSYIASVFNSHEITSPETTFTGTGDDHAVEQKAAGILSYVCYQRFKLEAISEPTLAELEAVFFQQTGFHFAKAFQWTIRMMLFFSTVTYAKGISPNIPAMDQDSKLLDPLSLCRRALLGLQRMNLFPSESATSSSSVPEFALPITASRLEPIWLTWLSNDSSWFLAPSALPPHLPQSMNIWLVAGRSHRKSS